MPATQLARQWHLFLSNMVSHKTLKFWFHDLLWKLLMISIEQTQNNFNRNPQYENYDFNSAEMCKMPQQKSQLARQKKWIKLLSLDVQADKEWTADDLLTMDERQ